MQEVRIQVLFTEDTPHGTFTDAIYYTPEEFDAVTQEQIDAEVAARVQNYIDVIEASQE